MVSKSLFFGRYFYFQLVEYYCPLLLLLLLFSKGGKTYHNSVVNQQ